MYVDPTVLGKNEKLEVETLKNIINEKIRTGIFRYPILSGEKQSQSYKNIALEGIHHRIFFVPKFLWLIIRDFSPVW